MNSARGSSACVARSRSNATSCSALLRSRSIKFSASRNSGRRPPEPRRHDAQRRRRKFPVINEFCKRLILIAFFSRHVSSIDDQDQDDFYPYEGAPRKGKIKNLFNG